MFRFVCHYMLMCCYGVIVLMCCYAVLPLYSYRVWKIFSTGKLRVVKITNTDLIVICSIIVGMDIVLNIIWNSVAPFSSERVVVDHYRPAYDYVQCYFNSTSVAFIYTHIAFKAVIVLIGMVLTFLARNVPSQFNEAAYMTAAIYNVAVLFAFGIPLIASNVGGRETVYQIRAYGIMMLVVSTLSILFIPKFYHIFSVSSVDPAGTQLTHANVDNTTKYGQKKPAWNATIGPTRPPATVPTGASPLLTAATPIPVGSPTTPNLIEQLREKDERITQLVTENDSLRKRIHQLEIKE